MDKLNVAQSTDKKNQVKGSLYLLILQSDESHDKDIDGILSPLDQFSIHWI